MIHASIMCPNNVVCVQFIYIDCLPHDIAGKKCCFPKFVVGIFVGVVTNLHVYIQLCHLQIRLGALKNSTISLHHHVAGCAILALPIPLKHSSRPKSNWNKLHLVQDQHLRGIGFYKANFMGHSSKNHILLYVGFIINYYYFFRVFKSIC